MNIQTSTSDFKQAIASATSKPKGVRVSPDLFKDLFSEGAVERKPATPFGLPRPLPSLETELPFFDKDIYVECDPFLDGHQFQLPQQKLAPDGGN